MPNFIIDSSNATILHKRDQQRSIDFHSRMIRKGHKDPFEDIIDEMQFENEMRNLYGGYCMPIEWMPVNVIFRLPFKDTVNPFMTAAREPLPRVLYTDGKYKYYNTIIFDVIPSQCGCIYP